MTTFSVSLFLPFTINFNNSDNASAGRSSPSPPRTRVPSFERLPTASLFKDSAPPDSPNAHQESEAFFLQEKPSSTALHFAKPDDPRTLARTDAHVPEWGRGRLFNQPRSRATAGPPSTILAYSKAQQEHAAARLSQTDGNASPRRGSVETRINESDWSVVPAVQGNGGLTNAIRAATDEGVIEHKLHVGTLGFPTDSLAQEKKDDIRNHLENEYDSLTVLINDNDFDGHYNRFCKTILWDSLNYQIPDHPKSKAYEDHSWVWYAKVNEAFADRIVQSYKHGDTIWVHDYHLLLVPGMVRKKLPDARIGFFLHTSFPSSEVFRCLAMRKQLLEGVLGANIIAFQCPEYANHFLQTCARLLFVEATETAVQLEDRVVEVTSVPIGICPEQLLLARQEDDVRSWISTITDKYKGKKLIVARDKLDSVRGVKQKLLAYDLFLARATPEVRESTVLIQVATSSMSQNKDLEGHISDIVTRINSQYSTLAHQPLVFLKQDIAFSQYIALLSAADVLMVTPLRDGMNLTCHEYVLCQDGYAGNKKHGPLILSEFTGSSSIFGERGGQLCVNPWDHEQMARAIRKALEMSDVERQKRYTKLVQVVMDCNGIHWISELRKRLDRAFDSHQMRDLMSVPRLSVTTLSQQYTSSSSRLFILDYEGTLAGWGHSRSIPPSPQRVIDTLSDLLARSEHNVVYLMSSRTPSELDQVFRQLPNVGLIAENGCFVRPFNGDHWVELADFAKASAAKESIMTLLQYYRERIDGSWIEEKACGFVFHYDGADDPEVAERQAGECANHIGEACQSQRMRCVPSKRAIIVEPMDTSKVTAAKWVLRSIQEPEQAMEDLSLVVSNDEQETFRPMKLSEAALSTPFVPFDNAKLGSISGYFDKIPMTPPTSSPELPSWRRSASVQSRDRAQSMSTASDVSSANPLDLTRQSSKTVGTRQKIPDFLMVAGDDREDEAVFRWANDLGKENKIASVVSVCVGKKNTEASSTLTQGVTGLLTALQRLSKS